MMDTNVLLISKSQVEDLFKNLSVTIDLVENSFRDFDNGSVMLPDKISQIFDEKTQDRINCMPSTLLNKGVSGVKWVSVFPSNQMLGIRNVSGMVVLSSLKNGYPIAVMDGTAITDFRTAAVGATGVKYLSREDSTVIGFIGAGCQARAHLDSIKCVRPGINKCFVSAKTNESVDDFINQESLKHPDITFVGCGNNHEKAVENADIIVTATSCQSDLLKAKWIKKGATYIHVGGWEDEYNVAKMADKIVCDSWESVKHRGQTICRMYKEGLLKDQDIYADMNDIISGKKIGRENPEEFIYFNSVGLSFIDISFAEYVYKNLKDKNEKTMFDFFR